MKKKWRKRFTLIQKQLILFYFYCAKIKYFSKYQHKKRIIICFDGIFSHGGLVDRLKGIVSFYEVAKRLDYDFYIYFEHPFQLSYFLEPNKVNWEIDYISYNLFSTKILYLMNNFDINPLELVQKYNSKTILVYSNVDYIEVMNIDNSFEENREIWRKNYHELFKQSLNLEFALREFKLDNRIVIHTRFTSLMGDFKDSTSLILDNISKQKLINKLINKINEIAVLHYNTPIYILSDSVFFLNYIKENTKYFVLEGIPKHMDMENNINNYSHLKTFTDFYFMAKSDSIYLLKFDNMHHSGFSKYAAIIGNTKWNTLLN